MLVFLRCHIGSTVTLYASSFKVMYQAVSPSEASDYDWDILKIFSPFGAPH